MVKHGRRIDSIGIVCTNGIYTRVLRAGGSGGSYNDITIPPNGQIYGTSIYIGKCNRKTTRVCGLQFFWKSGGVLGVSTAYGTPTGNSHYRYKRGGKLYGFRGRAGKNIDSLEPLYR